MATATAAAIRDQIHTLIEAITPTSLSRDKFRRYRNEDGANFVDFAEKNAANSFRRFQVRQVGDDETPVTTSSIEERVMLRAQLRVAYPQTARTGNQNAMDRDDVLNEDWLKINKAIGIYGRSNFTSTYDCTPMPARMSRDTGQGVDFLVVDLQYEYLRSVT